MNIGADNTTTKTLIPMRCAALVEVELLKEMTKMIMSQILILQCVKTLPMVPQMLGVIHVQPTSEMVIGADNTTTKTLIPMRCAALVVADHE